MLGASQQQRAAGSLRLRGWALEVLAGSPPAPPPAADAGTWDTFLRVERCAHPLRRILAAARVLETLDEVARRALERFGVNEAVAVLALRQEAAHVGRLLSGHGWRGIVLKGGAAVLGGACEVDVADLDVLVPPEQSQAVAALLDASGYHRHSKDFSPGDPNRHELATRHREHAIPVEVHFALAPPLEGDAWAGAVPLDTAGLLRLSSTNHLWHVLRHATLHHAERRGMLRDMLVAAAAVRWCSGDEVAEVERRCAAHPRGVLPGRMLRMACALAEGRVDDPFRREAAMAYVMHLAVKRYRPAYALLLALRRTAYALVHGHGEYGGLWYGSHVSAIPRGYAGGTRLDALLPAVGVVGRAAWRSANLAAAFAPAVWLARIARRLADRG